MRDDEREIEIGESEGPGAQYIEALFARSLPPAAAQAQLAAETLYFVAATPGSLPGTLPPELLGRIIYNLDSNCYLHKLLLDEPFVQRTQTAYRECLSNLAPDAEPFALFQAVVDGECAAEAVGNPLFSHYLQRHLLDLFKQKLGESLTEDEQSQIERGEFADVPALLSYGESTPAGVLARVIEKEIKAIREKVAKKNIWGTVTYQDDIEEEARGPYGELLMLLLPSYENIELLFSRESHDADESSRQAMLLRASLAEQSDLRARVQSKHEDLAGLPGLRRNTAGTIPDLPNRYHTRNKWFSRAVTFLNTLEIEWLALGPILWLFGDSTVVTSMCAVTLIAFVIGYFALTETTPATREYWFSPKVKAFVDRFAPHPLNAPGIGEYFNPTTALCQRQSLLLGTSILLFFCPLPFMVAGLSFNWSMLLAYPTSLVLSFAIFKTYQCIWQQVATCCKGNGEEATPLLSVGRFAALPATHPPGCLLPAFHSELAEENELQEVVVELDDSDMPACDN